MERPADPAEGVGVSLERHGDGAGVIKERIKEVRGLGLEDKPRGLAGRGSLREMKSASAGEPKKE